MTPDQRLAIILAAISTLGLPMLAFMIRATILWTRTQDRIVELAEDIRLITDQMREDRSATNERLTYIERGGWGHVARHGRVSY